MHGGGAEELLSIESLLSLSSICPSEKSMGTCGSNLEYEGHSDDCLR